jgi:V8-like Glu-specific endopeptidase
MKSSFTTESEPFTALETLEPEDAFEFEEGELFKDPSGSRGSRTPTGAFGVLTVRGRPSFRYAFTAKDALWLARFVIGEAGGRDDPGSRAVIWAMFNRYALFTYRVYPTFNRFLRAYSTPLQASLNSGGAAARHYQHPDFIRTGGNYTGRYAHVPRGQLGRFLRLQAKPWSSLPGAARGLAERALRGQVPNPIGNASEFEDTAVYFRQAHGRLPTMDEWRAYNAKMGRLKKRTWIGDVPGLRQYHKNAFFVDNRVANLPQGTVVITKVTQQTVPASAPSEQENPSGRFTALETLEPEDAFEFEQEQLSEDFGDSPRGSSLRQRIAEVAEREWRNWGQGTLSETAPAATQLLIEYYKVGVKRSRTTAELRSKSWQAKHPWSAVFVSYVMRVAGAGASFGYSAAHTGYVVAAKQAAAKHNAAKFRAFRIRQVPLEVGDVVCRDRVSIQNGKCFGTTFNNVESGGHSHGEIVVEVNPQLGYAITVGGNTSQEYPKKGLSGNTAGKHKIKIDGRGVVIPQGKCAYFAVLKPPTRAVESEASSFEDDLGSVPALETMEEIEWEEESSEPELAGTDSQLEWTEEELQYSIIVSPTSPGDDRFRITPRNKRPSTLMFPFNTICLLERNHIGGGVSRVTGTLITPQVVLTAKHCLTRLNVRTAAEGRRFSSIRVSPGADLSAARNQRPASPASITAAATRFRVHPTLDFGVIILPKAFRRPTQFMRLQARSDVNTATLLTIAGYPCDKLIGTMWGHSERIQLTDVSPTHLKYTIDTCPGHSGSPIWLLGNNAIRLLLGVHTNGPAGCNNDPTSGKCRPTGAAVTPVAGKNGGVRITCEVIDHITTWCREFKVTPPTPDSTYRQRCNR